MSMSQVWALGTEEFKATLAKDHLLVVEARAWDAAGVREIREQQWAELLAAGLRRAGQTAAEAQCERKSAPGKIALAAELKRATQVPNGWLAERLHMGSEMAVSQYVGQWRRAQAGRAESPSPGRQMPGL